MTSDVKSGVRIAQLVFSRITVWPAAMVRNGGYILGDKIGYV